MINANTPLCPLRPWYRPGPGGTEPARVASVKSAVPARPARRRASSTSYRYAHEKHCPMCHARLTRTPRRLQDRLWSLVTPLERYQCDRFTCQWIGNIKSRRAQQQEAQGARSRSIPKPACIAVALAGATVLALILHFATDTPVLVSARDPVTFFDDWVVWTGRLEADPIPMQTSATRLTDTEGRR